MFALQGRMQNLLDMPKTEGEEQEFPLPAFLPHINFTVARLIDVLSENKRCKKHWFGGSQYVKATD